MVFVAALLPPLTLLTLVGDLSWLGVLLFLALVTLFFLEIGVLILDGVFTFTVLTFLAEVDGTFLTAFAFFFSTCGFGITRAL